MTALLLALLLIQGAPATTGFATGVVRSPNGVPASGVRVYAMPAGDPNAAAAGPTVFESLAQTDASGRYRLEIRAGRYYIAVGSVSSPTYYPDTTSIAAARAITIAVGTTVESVDFSRYNPAPSSTSPLAARLQTAMPPGSTGVLSGVVRASDGSGVPGITVHAVPISVLNSTITAAPSFEFSFTGNVQQTVVIYDLQGAPSQVIRGGGTAVTDNMGRYRIENVTPDTYKILAGYSDSPVFYPGESDIQKAAAIATTPTTLMTSLDIKLSTLPKVFSVGGRVSINNVRPPGGATIILQPINAGAVTGAGLMLPSRSFKAPVTTGGDGRFELPNLSPGKYALQATMSGASPQVKNIEIADRDLTIDFEFSINVLSGRIVMEDGSSIPDLGLAEVAISTVSNPNMIASKLIPLSFNGEFSSVVDSGEYRFFIRSLPDGYIVRNITSGSTELSGNALRVMADVPTEVEIRITKGSLPGAKYQGNLVNPLTRYPPAADHIELCCFASGPFERLSTAILPDGSFNFEAVPAGRYTAELKSRGHARGPAEILNREIEIGNKDQSGVVLVFATETTPLTATVSFEDGTRVPSSAAVKVALTILPGANVSIDTPAAEGISIPMSRLLDDSFWTPFPTSLRFGVSVTNIPEGYKLKSISGPGGILAVDGVTILTSSASSAISIVLERAPNQ